MLVNNLPAIQVVLPLVAAPLCALIPSRGIAWLFTFAVSILTLIVSLTLLGLAFGHGPFTYTMGNWPAPFGIEYKIDTLNSFFLVLVSGIGVTSVLYGYRSVEEDISAKKHSLFYACFLLCLTGILGMLITNDAFNIYVFLEISSLASYTLIAMGKDKRALIAAFEYLILGTIGATFILIAIGLLYTMTGTLNISDLAARIPLVEHTAPVKAALAFFVVGLLLKIAVFPLHLWLTNAYTNAPSFVSSFLAATGTKVCIYILIRLLYSLFGKALSFEILPVDTILLTLGVLGIFIGAMAAIYEGNVKRLLAYSSVSQIGYILLGIGLGNQLGLQASLIHIFTHALAKCALFMAVGAMLLQRSSCRLNDFAGIGRTMPYTTLAFVISGLSLIGIPLTGGFINKWLLLQAAMDKQSWVLFAFILLTSLLAIVYIWKVVQVAYFKPDPHLYERQEAPLTMLVPLWILVTCTLTVGIYTTPLVGTTDVITSYLMNIIR
jgi:multicomponent Na+:H+ antiporter subunit D